MSPRTIQSLALAGLGVAAAAQESARPAEVLGLVQTISGRPVPDATVEFFPDPSLGVPWLPGLGPDGVRAHATEAGRYRFPAPPGTGCLLIQRDGIGAVVPDAATGVPQVVRLVPLGSVRCVGDGSIAAYVRYLAEPGRAYDLGRRDGSRIDLPPGTYHLLVQRGHHWDEFRCDVRSGQITELDPSKHRQAIRLTSPGPARTARLTLADWPAVPLCASADDTALLPRSSAPHLLRIQIHSEHGLFADFRHCDADDPSVTLQATVPTWREVLVTDCAGTPVPNASVYTLAAAAGRPRVIAVDRTGTDGVARTPLVEADLHLVAWHPDYALASARPRAALTRLLLPPASGVQILCLSSADTPIAFANVTASSSHSLAISPTWRSDRYGVVHARLPSDAPVAIRIEHADWLPSDLLLSTQELQSGRVNVRLRPGSELRGLVLQSSTAPSSEAIVELRDSTSVLGVSPRTTTVAEDGTFVFRGLPDGLYTLFVTAHRAGVTWSGKLHGVQPGPTVWEVPLRNEDPPEPHRR
jgi:hypothetical protein